MKVTFRGGYVEDDAGDRWWSEELLARAERQRDASREEIARLDAAIERLKRQRDKLRAEVERLRWDNEMACENTPTRDCECPGCETARSRAAKGEVGP